MLCLFICHFETCFFIQTAPGQPSGVFTFGGNEIIACNEIKNKNF